MNIIGINHCIFFFSFSLKIVAEFICNSFRNCIKNAKEEFKNLNQDSNLVKSANSFDIKLHISWDFAEQVYIPYSSQQVVCIVFFTNNYMKGK